MKDQMRSMLDEKEDLLDPEYLVALKKMYRACMNETGVELESWSYLKGLIGRAGGWPLMDSYKWKEYGYDWKIAVHKLRKEGYDFPYFLTLSIELDLEDSDKYAIYVSREFDVIFHHFLNLINETDITHWLYTLISPRTRTMMASLVY